jgi:hypothetical protein
MTWVLMIFFSMPGIEPRLVGWAEYSTRVACEDAGSHLKLSKKDTWRCVQEST